MAQFFLYALVSGSCESMIGYTAGLGVLSGAVSCTHILVCLGTVPHVGNSVLRGNAVIRAMMWIVTRHMHGRVSVYVGCIALISCSA